MPPAKPTFEPLRMHFAVNNGDVKEAKRQLTRGISLEYVTQGYTPLLLAIIKEQTEIALLLARGGADVNHAEQTKQARLPIHVAAKYGNVEIVKALVENGASVHSIDNDSMTALHVACYEGHLDLVKYLIDAGAHLNCPDGRGRSPLFNAIGYNHVDVVKYLISEGGIVNCVDNIGWTPLIESVVCGYFDLVTVLLNNCANVHIPDRNGNTPLHHACSRLSSAQQMCLIATNIDYNMRHLSTLTPVTQRAIRHIYSYVYEIVQVLIDFGAEVNAKNVDEETCLDIAVTTEKHQVINMIISAGGEFSYVEQWVPTGIYTMPYLTEITDSLSLLSVPHVKSLMNLCKFSIRKSIGIKISSGIKSLPLPESLKGYLQVENSLSASDNIK